MLGEKGCPGSRRRASCYERVKLVVEKTEPRVRVDRLSGCLATRLRTRVD